MTAINMTSFTVAFGNSSCWNGSKSCTSFIIKESGYKQCFGNLLVKQLPSINCFRWQFKSSSSQIPFFFVHVSKLNWYFPTRFQLNRRVWLFSESSKLFKSIMKPSSFNLSIVILITLMKIGCISTGMFHQLHFNVLKHSFP